jgi:hypothetical protein
LTCHLLHVDNHDDEKGHNHKSDSHGTYGCTADHGGLSQITPHPAYKITDGLQHESIPSDQNELDEYQAGYKKRDQGE